MVGKIVLALIALVVILVCALAVIAIIAMVVHMFVHSIPRHSCRMCSYLFLSGLGD